MTIKDFVRELGEMLINNPEYDNTTRPAAEAEAFATALDEINSRNVCKLVEIPRKPRNVW